MCKVFQRQLYRQIFAPLIVKVSIQPNTTLKHLLMRPKDRAHESEKGSFVYQIHCAICPATYVRQTNRRLTQQLKENRHAVESGTQPTKLWLSMPGMLIIQWIGPAPRCWLTIFLVVHVDCPCHLYPWFPFINLLLFVDFILLCDFSH